MVKHNKMLFAFIILGIIFGCVAGVAGSAQDNEVKRSFSHLDAADIGVFNIGLALGGVVKSFDETLKKDVLRFEYSLPKGSIIGVWTKDYPPAMNANVIDAVRFGVNVPNISQLRQVSVKAEIKGTKGMQKIPLYLRDGWNYIQEAIDWNTIGDLREVVFVVSPTSIDLKGASPLWFSPSGANSMNGNGSAEGVLDFVLDFYTLTFLQKYFIFVKVGSVLLTGLLTALMAAFLGISFGRSRVSKEDRHPLGPSLLSRLKRDLVYGTAAVLVGGLALFIYSMGRASPLDAGFSCNFLAVGLMAAVIAQVLKYEFTGKGLTPVEVFQDVLVTGLLAASSSRLAILQAPSTWNQVFMLSSIIAALTFLIYHVSNAYSLASYGRHLKVLGSVLIVGTPYLLGWLLLAENGSLLQTLGNDMTARLIARWPAVLETVGRLLVVFVFNEVFTNGISLAINGKILKAPKAHLFILFVSFGVVVSPLIADIGSTKAVASLPVAVRAIAVILTTMFSFAGLWGEVYLITGIALDSGRHLGPSLEAISDHVIKGMKKGMAYSGILMGILYVLYMLLDTHALQKITASLPIFIGTGCGALLFPLLKTIVETFDGSQPFFQRTRHSYRDASLYARGAIAGFGFAYAVSHDLIQWKMPDRIIFGLIIGLVASGGVSVLRDAAYACKGQGRIQSWRLYFIDALLGVFIGSAAAFYLDSLQVPVVVKKFKLYTSSGYSPTSYITYPLVNKWGRIDLGSYTGGVKLLFTESLAGVINWSIAAWLFAINKVFMQAYFEKDKAPIKFFFSKAGFAQLIEHMIYVLRWGLWMSPIIFTFLRMMPDPTWYNQDGAIRTLFAVYNNVTMTPEAFRAWSLNLFVYILAFDLFRVLIWMDHMGLRVATLVNLSFLGLDRLDERIARFIGPATAQRYIPEAVKRFTTWAPLLIPFYLPRAKEWDYAWNTSEAMQNAPVGGICHLLSSLALQQTLILIGLAILAFTGISFGIRLLRDRSSRRRLKTYELRNREYKVVLKENGEIYSDVEHKKRDVFPKEYDISRRSYDIIDPCGRILYLVDTAQHETSDKRYWPVIGNFPKERFEPSRIEKCDDSLKVVNTSNGVRTTIEIGLASHCATAELWEITVENLTYDSRQLKIVPYLEWLLNGGIHDRFHTQYARLFVETGYASEANAILSWQRSTKSMGVLAVDIPPEGLLTSRMDFIGRGQSVWKPRALETLKFTGAVDTAPSPTFDPIGSLIVDAALNPRASKKIRLVIGYVKNKEKAIELAKRCLRPRTGAADASSVKQRRPFLIGHGEIPAGTAQPYSEFIDNGNKLAIHTPFTPRPYDHAMSNAAGHSVMVTNRGLHTSCNGNSQQNRLTPDWPDTVTKEVPTEAIYLYDPDGNEWYSPTYHPLNDPNAKNESEFGVDGTAVFRMTRGMVSTELTVFVPPDDPMGVYLLTVKNNADRPKRMRIAPYFQMVLAFQPERSGLLQTRYDQALGALFFANPRNEFCQGSAFVSMSIAPERVEMRRGRFFGTGRWVSHPFMVEKGEPDVTQLVDDRQIASLLGTVELPAKEERTIAIILGQTDKRPDAVRLVKKYKDIETVRKSLENTRRWWLGLMGTVEVKTNNPEFDRFQNWLKYQALAERIWARRGFYQTSGAFGFRDQLQDTVNIMWVDPSLARRQIILHASHQFLEGDVYHWFFTRTDGRTAFSCRSHASDNPIWLVWGVTEYIKATGDYSILDEMTSYVWSEFPFADLPRNKQGWGHLYQRSTRADSVYRHCMRSIDLVLKKRMGKHGLPLIRTGDWNDGLDEIGSEGRGESVWLGFFLYYVMKDMVDIIERVEGVRRKEYYLKKMKDLEAAIERTWRGDRYLRAIHDDGTEIGVKDSGVWEIDALTAAWAVMAGINPERGLTIFNTAVDILEKEKTILLGWPALCEDTKPYLGRSSKYPEGVRENGMYCHGVQWLIGAARILAEGFEKEGNHTKADEYRKTAYRLWLKISPIPHVVPQEIEIYGGQPNKQSADMLTNFDPGRMIWHGYTGAAGWMLRQALEGVIGASLIRNEIVLPPDFDKPRGELKASRVHRNMERSPLRGGYR